VPQERDCGPLEEVIAEMEEFSLAIGKYKKAMSASARAVAKADKALRQWAQDNRVCPTCGAALDPDRLVKAAASGLKGHVHG
jgi:NADH pyrophosphatase NudC (nudix superfamily)